MNDPLPVAWRWGAVILLALLAVVRAGTAPAVFDVAVLGLAGLALLPVVGWLRTLWFAPVAAAGFAAWSAASLLHRGQAVTVAFVAATVAGAAVGAATAWVTQRVRPAVRPWVSLVVAVATWAVVLPRATSVASGRPLLFGVDLASDRALAITSLVLLAGAVWMVTNLAAARAGREIATTGASATFAARVGASASDAWVRAGVVSGVLSGWAGLLLALKLQGLPALSQFAPAVAVTWLAVPLLGGASWVSGALLGAVLVGGIAPLAQLPAPVVAGAALAVGAVLGEQGLVGLLARRTGAAE